LYSAPASSSDDKDNRKIPVHSGAGMLSYFFVPSPLQPTFAGRPTFAGTPTSAGRPTSAGKHLAQFGADQISWVTFLDLCINGSFEPGKFKRP